MAIYTTKEICELIGITAGVLRVYKQRKIINIVNGTIDDSDLFNKSFLEKQLIKKDSGIQKPKKEIKKSPEKIKIQPSISEKQKPDDKDDKEITGNIFYQKTKWEVQRLKNQDKLNKIQIAKLEGQLIPVDAATEVFLWAAETLKKNYERYVENQIGIYIQILGGEQSQYVDLRKKLLFSLQQAGENAKLHILNGVENIIKEYSEVRNRGEKK